MFKKDSLGISILVLGTILSASAAAFANDMRNLTLPSDIVLQGTHLQAGEYTITWFTHSPTLKVAVSHGKKVLLTASAKLVECGSAYDRDTIVVSTEADGTKALQGIIFAGSSQAIVFDVGAQQESGLRFTGSDPRYTLPYSGNGTGKIYRSAQ
jgi:Tfp pilus assembly protein PilX